jgi:hypothetical protein
LYRYLFPPAWRTLDPGGFGYIGSHGETESAQELDALGNGIHQFHLLVIVLVE